MNTGPMHDLRQNHGGGVSHQPCSSGYQHQMSAKKRKAAVNYHVRGQTFLSHTSPVAATCPAFSPEPSVSPSVVLPRRLTELHSSGVTKDPASRDCLLPQLPRWVGSFKSLEICHRLIAVLIRPRLRYR